jgi:4-hydroxy-tetrahydrodipicolinate synthase
MVTPFAKSGEVDYAALNTLVEYLIKGGVDYLVVQGTTGEAATLNTAEKQQVLDAVIAANQQRIPIVFGHGGNNTRALLEAFDTLNLSGVDAILSASPYYNKPTQAGIIAHYRALADVSPKPVILYNVPGRTASNLTADTTLALANHPNIIGIKEASANFSQISALLKYRPEGFLIISGDDITALGTIACGADGVISVVGNVVPNTYSNMVKSALKGDFKTASALHLRTATLVDLLFAEGNPGGIKAALNAKGILGEGVRLPLVPVSTDLKKKIAKELEGIS